MLLASYWKAFQGFILWNKIDRKYHAPFYLLLPKEKEVSNYYALLHLVFGSVDKTNCFPIYPILFSTKRKTPSSACSLIVLQVKIFCENTISDMMLSYLDFLWGKGFCSMMISHNPKQILRMCVIRLCKRYDSQSGGKFI